MLTLQEIHDKIDKEFKGKAVDSNGYCQYLTEDGKKCAIGLFIPDGHRAQQCFENVLGILRKYPNLEDHMPFTNLSMLSQFQLKHDALKTDLPLDVQKDMLKQIATELYKAENK